MVDSANLDALSLVLPKLRCALCAALAKSSQESAARLIPLSETTVAFAAGSDPKSVQGMLGHATAAFTLDRYGHVTERMMKDTANRMQNYYDGLSKMG